MAFQAKHWFDSRITIRWLEWLQQQYEPDKKILLIWDHAPAHDSEEVATYLAEHVDRLVVCLIPGGLTSVLQVCDLACNAQLKTLFKAHYLQWRAGQLRRLQAEYEERVAELSETGVGRIPKPTLKRDRSAIIHMVEAAFRQFNDEQSAKVVEERTIRKTFQRAGQDPFAEDLSCFDKHIADLMDNPTYRYGTLTAKETANQLTDKTLAAQMAELQL